MGMIQNILKGIGKDKSEFKEQLKQAQLDDKIQRIVEERKMSANERDLLKRMKQKREEGIKKQLDTLRKKDSKENWKSKNSILAQETNILKNDRPILKEKNIFLDNRNKVPLQTTREGMFFRW